MPDDPPEDEPWVGFGDDPPFPLPVPPAFLPPPPDLPPPLVGEELGLGLALWVGGALTVIDADPLAFSKTGSRIFWLAETCAEPALFSETLVEDPAARLVDRLPAPLTDRLTGCLVALLNPTQPPASTVTELGDIARLATFGPEMVIVAEHELAPACETGASTTAAAASSTPVVTVTTLSTGLCCPANRSLPPILTNSYWAESHPTDRFKRRRTVSWLQFGQMPVPLRRAPERARFATDRCPGRCRVPLPPDRPRRPVVRRRAAVA